MRREFVIPYWTVNCKSCRQTILLRPIYGAKATLMPYIFSQRCKPFREKCSNPECGVIHVYSQPDVVSQSAPPPPLGKRPSLAFCDATSMEFRPYSPLEF